jgi:hypothetical protein
MNPELQSDFSKEKTKSDVINELPNQTAFSGLQKYLQFFYIPLRKRTHPTDKTTIGEQATPHLTCRTQCQLGGCCAERLEIQGRQGEASG